MRLCHCVYTIYMQIGCEVVGLLAGKFNDSAAIQLCEIPDWKVRVTWLCREGAKQTCRDIGVESLVALCVWPRSSKAAER